MRGRADFQFEVEHKHDVRGEACEGLVAAAAWEKYGKQVFCGAQVVA